MNVPEHVEKIVAPVLAQEGLELVDVEYQREPRGWTLRLYVDKPGGFSLNDCAAWNDRIGNVIDDQDVISGPYSLEISSPGLNRPLKKKEDFEKHVGIDAVVKLYAPLNGQKNFHGKIVAVQGEELHLYDRTAGLVKLSRASIAGAKLDPPININKNKEGKKL